MGGWETGEIEIRKRKSKRKTLEIKIWRRENSKRNSWETTSVERAIAGKTKNLRIKETIVIKIKKIRIKIKRRVKTKNPKGVILKTIKIEKASPWRLREKKPSPSWTLRVKKKRIG